LTPDEKRKLAGFVWQEHEGSERRACAVFGLSRKVARYTPHPRDYIKTEIAIPVEPGLEKYIPPPPLNSCAEIWIYKQKT